MFVNHCCFAPQQELLDLYTLNLHRIDKDVQRCDRNYWYFTPANLEKLRNIMCRYTTDLVFYKVIYDYLTYSELFFLSMCLSLFPFCSIFFLTATSGSIWISATCRECVTCLHLCLLFLMMVSSHQAAFLLRNTVTSESLSSHLL